MPAEVRQPDMGKPHVVILGAGCSRAAVPDGDANGLHLPLMQDFLQAGFSDLQMWASGLIESE